MADSPLDADDLLALARGYMPSRVFLTALELGIFRHLAGRKLTAAELACDLKTDRRATEILLNALVGMGLLAKHDDVFANRRSTSDLLVADGPRHYQGAVAHAGHLWEPWSHLTEIVRDGRPQQQVWTSAKRRDLALAMKYETEGVAERMAPLLDCSTSSTILDLGSGPGSCAIALARRYPHVTAVLFDRDDTALEIAQEEVTATDLADRIALKQGDFLRDDLGSDYDLVLLSSILCILGEEDNVLLLTRVWGALKDGGRVVIRDFILDDSKTALPAAAMFAVHMLVSTPRGRAYSNTEVRTWLRNLGFKSVHRIPTEPLHLIIGTK